MMNGGYGFGVWGIFSMLFHIAIVVGVIYLIFYLFQSVFKRNTSDSNYRPNEKTSLQILEERFARGEIDEVEFKQKKKVLKE
ncbi:SHOCT domain-containing protein [Bacillaceae bacterium IKA-2]|nr:SHOCT domain-containing protein [Bacillaceae bacterium IKA-2]